MNDRDRLAADLKEASNAFVHRKTDFAARWDDWAADHLIALGWTRLDEERLARALVAVDIESVGEKIVEWWRMGPKPLAAAIAKAYWEDEG